MKVLAGRSPRPVGLSALRIGSLLILVVAVVVGLLPGPTVVTAYAADIPGEAGCFLEAGELTCPPVLAPADLVPPETMQGLPADQADALLKLQEQAADNVIAHHDLADTDRAAVLTFARYDALAELWALILKAFETPKAERSAAQQSVVDWLADRMRYLRAVSPPYAAREYAKFAGKNLNLLDNLLWAGAGEQEIKEFLSGTPQPYDIADTSRATGGYCRYRPPAPFEGEFDGSTLQSCFTPCQNVFGCAPTTPSYEQFVKWGSTHIGSLLDSQAVVQQSALIASATLTAGAVAGTGLATVLVAMAQTIFPYAGAAAGAWALSAISIAAIASVVVIVIAAIAIAAVAGVNVVTIGEMPGKLAGAIAQSRQPVDADALWATADGKATIFALFVDAVSPAPREDKTCDNQRVADKWRSWFDGEPIRVFAWEIDDLDVSPCLNPPAVPPATDTDPYFEVTDSTGLETEAPSITVSSPAPATSTSIRVRGDNWFVVESPVGHDSQTLRINYTDWDGRTNIVWLRRTGDGYTFRGIRERADGSLTFDPDDCDICWTSDELRYVGPDGQQRSARIAFHQPPVGQPSYSGEPLVTHAPVTFDANGFRPGNAEGPVTYEWRFQKAGCNLPCTRLGPYPKFEVVPDYLDPVGGTTVTHAWPTAGTYHAEVTATDSEGHQASTALVVPIASVPPRVTLARDCSLGSLLLECNNAPTRAGSESSVFGGIHLTGDYERMNVNVGWGDGTSSSQVAGFLATYPGADPGQTGQPGNPVRLSNVDDHHYALTATHTYSEPGYYTVTVAARDQYGAADSETVALTIKGPQKITFGELANRHYGDTFVANATGTRSGFPVTYTAGPEAVCTSTGPYGAGIVTVGVGECTVTAHQAGGGDVFEDAVPVSRTFEVLPAQLTIRAEDATKTYGASDPEYSARFLGLRNGDTAADLDGLEIHGPPADSDAGVYDLVPSGVTAPNYAVEYVNGHLRIERAPLTITPDDQTRVYGGNKPAYTAWFDGLVNGDTPADITGLQLTGPPKDAHVGEHDIRADFATNPNYDIEFADGTETITPAPLTIRAQDKTTKYGTVATYTWNGDGWVNGDSDATIDTAPTCTATIQGAAASVTTAPGAYLGAITCSGAADSDYEIDYASGGLTVNPVIRLDQTGLPSTVARRATIDGKVVTLPTSELEVGYGTAHGYSFPAVVTDASGVAYMTRTTAFTGPVVGNLVVTASYSTMSGVLAGAVAGGGLDQRTASSLTKMWNDVQAGIKSGNLAKARGSVKQFADAVRAQRGKKIKTATADTLLAYAQLVHTHVGGGTL